MSNLSNDMIDYKHYESYIELLIYIYYNNDYLNSSINEQQSNLDIYLKRIENILNKELITLPKHHTLIETFKLYHTKFTNLKRDMI